MIYGKDKAIEMARSLLPSTRGKGAKDSKNIIKRTARHNIREELHMVAIDPDYYDDCSTDFNAYPEHELREVVYDRRGGDKTHPFERWAEAITKGVEQDSRLTFVKSLVPEGVIGDHAISHLKWKDHFASQAKKELEANIRQYRLERGKKNSQKLTHEEEVSLLRKIVEDGLLHRELNKFVSYNAYRKTASETRRVQEYNDETKLWIVQYKTFNLDFPPGTPRTHVRKLLGLHDIENYLNDVKKSWRLPSIITINGERYSNPDAFENAYASVRTFLLAVRDHNPLPKRLPANLYYY